MRPSDWSIELWTNGIQTADLGGRAKGRRIKESRNESDDISWALDLNELKRYCRSIGTTPGNLIQDGITEVRVKKYENYMAGGTIVHTQKVRNAQSEVLSIRARGFFDLLADRYTSGLRTFTDVERTTIPWTLIDESQSQGALWNFGITQGLVAPSLGVYSRQYQNTRLKDAIQDLTKLQTAFDVKLMADKTFNVYAQLGSLRPDIVFEYPGNCKELTTDSDATNLANMLYLLGSGIGQQSLLQLDLPDANSQIDYKVREKPLVLSDILDSGTLNDYGLSYLAAWARAFEIPKVKYDGRRGPAVSDYIVGDYVSVRETDDPDTQLSGLFRVESREIVIDDNDNEDVTVEFGR
ncbi:hypothetical protein QF038_001856 [Pseudarthrobacter sp. W1I19]|uniref:hypothetical protein n=1 Tax=Pseudarthrobacter sp. W1I19 TaxID=3042288 RepID=UPI00278A7835|nr:hypothetical protein [Pseudarthrobacter sp. W1I19]MDQ0923348.1 hypothetical protein [Pseudarthrobacter sp. W1I19]